MTDTTTNDDWHCYRCNTSDPDWAEVQCVHCDCCCECLGCLYGPRDGMLMFPQVTFGGTA